jgi:hypothetical protein
VRLASSGWCNLLAALVEVKPNAYQIGCLHQSFLHFGSCHWSNLHVGHRFVSVAEVKFLAKRIVGKEKPEPGALVRGLLSRSEVRHHQSFDKLRCH